MEIIFPTFCHISEYGQQGYEALHRMIASSAPLILWSPSGLMLDHYHSIEKCRISTEELLRYVENGRAQIIGRERWILDKKFRQQHPWEGAKWLDNFDGVIKSICNEDERLPESQRRVRVVEEEDGYRWADKFLAEEPQTIDEIWRLIRYGHAPVGSLQRAKLQKTKKGAVREVLRDARNHARAFELAIAQVPFISHREGKFFRLLEVKHGQPAEPANNTETRARSGLVKVSQEMLRLLERLDQLQKPSTFKSFVGSEAHRELTQWLCLISATAREVRPQAIDRYLLKDLKQRIEGGYSKPSWSHIIVPEGRWDSLVTFGGLATSIVGFAMDPTLILGITGLILSIVPIGTGISRRLGLVRPDYHGPQWPFLYTFGAPPKSEHIMVMKRLLDELT